MTHKRPDADELAWSPNGKKIAFVSWSGTYADWADDEGTPEIYVVTADGSVLTNLTRSDYWDFAPTWSPGGRRIAFQSARMPSGPSAEIHSIALDGTRHRNLTRSPHPDHSPAWSPSGKSIAFESGKGRHSEVFVMSASGRNRRALTRTPRGTGNGSPLWAPR